METRNFVGKDMNEALKALRASLGPDALILQTRRVPANNGTKVEVTAMQGEAKSSAPEPQTKGPSPKETNSARDLRPAKKPEALSERHQLRSVPLGGGESTAEAGGDLRALRQEIAELKALFRWVAPSLGRGTVMEELMIQGVSPEIIARLTHEIQGSHDISEREQMRRALARVIPTGGDVEEKGLRRECLALIGPTGVGKTTTMVKLTAHLVRRGERRVGWVSLDNRRIAGSEQLVVYAGVLGIPCEEVDSKEGLYQALERFSSCDLVLIDTAGISPRDDKGLVELAQLTQHIPDIRRTLLLSATTNSRDLIDWVPFYDKIGFDSFLFTKLDEGRYFGSVLNTTLTYHRPLSYFTLGQGVTNSLEPATSETLARLLLP